jgi:DNA-binding CsgD family transcriptional regulator
MVGGTSLWPLVQSLLASGAPPDAWRLEMVARLREELGFDSALLVPTGRPPLMVNKEGFQHLFAQHVRSPERYAPTLEALRSAAQLRDGACVDVGALSVRERTRSLFYDEVIRPQGITSQVYAFAELHGRLVWTLFLCRHGRTTPFDRDVAVELARVLPALAAAHVGAEWAHAANALDMLSTREHDVAALVSRGMRTREIATLLGTSPNTVKNQIARIFGKLEVTTRAELAALVRSALP